MYLLIVLAAALSLAVVPIRWHLQSHGAPVPVTVTGKYVSHSSRGGDHYHVKFDYVFDGQTVSDSQELSYSEYDPIQIGDAATGRAERILGMNFCLTSLGNIDRGTHEWMFISGLWNAIAWFFIIFSVSKILRTRRLVQEGIAAPGVVTNRRSTRGRNTYWYVAYQFTTAGGETLLHERAVSRAAYNRVAIGSPVTVLYQADNPGRSIAYECCNYIVEM
jgi:hypothetical protein